ncbi:MAG: hypothetical protein E7262_03660 [Lachnospiraceae bacterium]|nr:hypothetical protein [Lachnospiraceae bacterium]
MSKVRSKVRSKRRNKVRHKVISKVRSKVLGKGIIKGIGEQRGSLTVEATLVLTIYLMAVITFVNLLLAIDASAHIYGAMYKGAYEVSMNIKKNIVSADAFENNKVKGHMDNKYIDKTPIINGMDGINIVFEHSGDKEQDIMVKSKYAVNIPFFNVMNVGYKMNQSIKCRAFTGDLNSKSNKKFVYITKTGKVYHTNVQCTYLLVKKCRVSLNDIEDLRNSGGGKYDQCRECKNEINNTGYVYITNYGTSYHKTITCCTITRTVRAIEIDDIKGRKACEKCIDEKIEGMEMNE